MPNGTRSIIWANGEDEFCIAKIGQLLELEDKCNAGVAEILARLTEGRWRVNDVRETIRLGLIGGGMAADKAMIAVKRHVDPPNPLGASLFLAFEILQAAIVGVPGDTNVGKKKTEEADRRDDSSAPKSTASAPPSDSIRARSTP